MRLGQIAVSGLVTLALVSVGHAGEQEGWFVSFERVEVAPVDRENTTQLIEAGRISTDGFSELVFSLGGEFKQVLPKSGTIGAILIPDVDVFQYLLRNEGYIAFPLEAKYSVAGLERSVFISEQQTARVAFPAYRVYFYNETTSGASVSLYVYRTRR